MSESQHAIVLGCQWGDEGKGKVVDILAGASDMVVRFQGGANAGHTIVVDGRKFVLHLLPSGILRPGLVNVIGNGCVVDPVALVAELDQLDRAGLAVGPERLLLSHAAHLITPDLLAEDRRTGGAIGTTGRGIGPAYGRKALRTGVRCESLLDGTLADRAPAVTGDEAFLAACRRLSPFVTDTAEAIGRTVESGRRLLYEGAQGALLDLDLGSYPYVTSSTTTIGGAFSGSGVFVDFSRRIGIVKAYSTRVGNGPFPTELADATGEHLRSKGHEFGSTTGRPRRCGWLDLHLLKKAVMANGINEVVLTKLDCLAGLEEIPVAVGRDGTGRPLFHRCPGWAADISTVSRFEDLPKTAIDYIGFIELHMKVPIRIISVGPGRSQTILRGVV